MRKLIFTWLACSFTAIATMAHAQPAAEPTPSAWRVTMGRDVVALRDISGTGIPVDASPVAWRGTGVGLFAQHTRQRGRWAHVFSATATRATTFEYDLGITTIPRSTDDRFTRIDARYEWRRQLFSDLWVRGVSIAAGLQVGALRTGVSRHVPVDIVATESRVAGVTALVVAVGFRRARGPGLEVAWANGGQIGRLSGRHSADQLTRTQWGGGWQSDLAITGDIPIGRRTSVFARFATSNDGVLSSHRSVASDRSSISLGVMYGR
jgi:hypothetical protein